MSVEKDTFGFFGKAFQENLCQLILLDRPFADQIKEVLTIEFLELKYLFVFVIHGAGNYNNYNNYTIYTNNNNIFVVVSVDSVVVVVVDQQCHQSNYCLGHALDCVQHKHKQMASILNH